MRRRWWIPVVVAVVMLGVNWLVWLLFCQDCGTSQLATPILLFTVAGPTLVTALVVWLVSRS